VYEMGPIIENSLAKRLSFRQRCCIEADPLSRKTVLLMALSFYPSLGPNIF